MFGLGEQFALLFVECVPFVLVVDLGLLQFDDILLLLGYFLL